MTSSMFPFLKIEANQATILIPPSLTFSNAILFSESLFSIPSNYVCNFECSYVKHAEPFSMLYTYVKIRQFLKFRNPSTTFYRLVNNASNQYAKYMGLLGNFTGSKPASYSPGNRRYARITEVKTEELLEQSNMQNIYIAEYLENNLARELASILCQSNENYRKTLEYSLRESLRNVFEHSESTTLFYCAQYWPSKDKVEIAIIDEGVGLFNSLSKTGENTVSNDTHALDLALTAGVTGATQMQIKNAGEWGNSGYGLYMISGICKESGSFTLVSGSKGVFLDPSQKYIFNSNLSGTGIRLIIKPSMLKNLTETLEKLNRESMKKRTHLTSSMMYKGTPTD